MAMTASVTRSRRADGLHLPNPKIANAHHGHRLLANAQDHYAPRPAKRQLDASDRDFDNIVAKKARFTTGIAVEIPARPLFHARFTRETADKAKQAPPPPPTAPKPAIAAPNLPTSHRAPPANGPQKSAPASTQQQPTLTKHQEKVANGLKHELNRLQPSAADTKEQGRKLRSQEATRFKSELSAYFPEYDEVIGNDPKETHLLNLDTPIIIVPDSVPPAERSSSSSQQQPKQHQQLHPIPQHQYPVRSYNDTFYTDLFDAQRIDFSFLNKNNNTHNGPQTTSSTTSPTTTPADDPDPLPDTLYEPAHRKAERLERSIRNSEKGRAQHEKDQIIRLLDGLQGHDWLRVMGVSGITESKKRAFEPAREHFIRGCEGILGKFRRWAREEKRRRVEMMERRAEREGESEEEEEEGEEEEEEEEVEDEEREGGESDDEAGDGEGAEEGQEEGEPPDESDVDASIAKQLREEALAAAAKKKINRARLTAKRAATTTSTTTRGKAGPHPLPPAPAPEPEEEQPPREFTSFFAKRYQREAALSKSRRRGRNVLAWGRPVPDVAEAEFELPADLVDEETLRSHARRKRRDKRVRS